MVNKEDVQKAIEFVKSLETKGATRENAILLLETTKKVIQQMGDLNLPITPDKFEIWFYTFLVLFLKGKFNPKEEEILNTYVIVFHEIKGKPKVITEVEKQLIKREVDETLNITSLLIKDTIETVERYNRRLIEKESAILTIKTIEDINLSIKNLIEEIKLLQQTNRELKEELNKSLRKIEVLKEKIKALSEKDYKDPLTNLFSRAKLEPVIDNLIKKSPFLPFCLAIIDIDDFRKLNDFYGHKTGDELLKKVAEVLIGETRTNDYGFRYGGEEFAIIISEVNLKEAIVVCERIRRRISEIKIPTEKGVARTTVSIGIAEAKIEDTAKEIIERADKSLHIAKLDGKNCIRTEIDLLSRQ